MQRNRRVGRDDRGHSAPVLAPTSRCIRYLAPHARRTLSLLWRGETQRSACWPARRLGVERVEPVILRAFAPGCASTCRTEQHDRQHGDGARDAGDDQCAAEHPTRRRPRQTSSQIAVDRDRVPIRAARRPTEGAGRTIQRIRRRHSVSQLVWIVDRIYRARMATRQLHPLTAPLRRSQIHGLRRQSPAGGRCLKIRGTGRQSAEQPCSRSLDAGRASPCDRP
jgi:hypothetical protein